MRNVAHHQPINTTAVRSSLLEGNIWLFTCELHYVNQLVVNFHCVLFGAEKPLKVSVELRGTANPGDKSFEAQGW